MMIMEATIITTTMTRALLLLLHPGLNVCYPKGQPRASQVHAESYDPDGDDDEEGKDDGGDDDDDGANAEGDDAVDGGHDDE